MGTKRNRVIQKSKPFLGITMGDPSGIGPEVIAKALSGTKLRRVCFSLIIGSLPVMQQTVKKLRLKLDVRSVEGHDRNALRTNQIAAGVSDVPQELRLTVAVAQPTPCTHTFWKPSMSGAMSLPATIMFALNDSSIPSPAR